ncbi:unnamed protein product [Lactuca virosa]|uniref:CRAL-TRIO domain-containing protein n=1 Tax=Lactuca virosa TaxID=75947 RepID=A0AAU9LQF2_9ASTR|nr:unnamed protein product [Lactuca virosa]
MVILEVNLIQAQSLTNKDLIDKSDPFVKLYTCNLHSMMQINKVIVFINVPWWYLAFYTMMSPFITERTKSKSVFASPTRTSKTLFIYVTPKHVPNQHRGLTPVQRRSLGERNWKIEIHKVLHFC